MKTLKSIYVKNRINLITFLSIILAIIGIIEFFFIFNITAQSNDECLWMPKLVKRDSTSINYDKMKDSLIIVFDKVKVDGVAYNAGIRTGDELISIDGIKAKNSLIATFVLDHVNSGDYATYVVKHEGKLLETKVLVKKLIDFSGLAFTLLSFIWLVVGFIIVMAKPDGKVQNAFYRISIFAVLYSLASLVYRGEQVANNHIYESSALLFFIDLFRSLGGAFLPFVYVHFFLLFPSKYKILNKKYFNIVWYSFPSLFFIIMLMLRSPLLFRFNFPFLSMYLGLANLYVIFAAIFAGTILLFFSYAKLKNKEERNAIFVILISCLFVFGVLIYTITLQNALADTVFNTPQYFMPIIFMAVIPLGFGYSIFRYSLMDMSHVLKNSILYVLATISLAGIYFFLIYLIGQGLSSIIGTEYQGIIAGAIFIFFAMVFQSTKDKFQRVITKKFYPEQFAYQMVLLKFSSDVASTVGLDNILDSTLHTFVEHLRLKHFGILLYEDSTDSYILERYEGFFNGNLSIKADEKILNRFIEEKILYKAPIAIERSEFENVFSSDVVDKLLEESIYTVIPLRTKSKIIGFLLFGLKFSGSQFSGKDLELLIAAANQTSVSIENARLYAFEARRFAIERDLENARTMQESLLPNIIPQFPKVDIAGTMIPAMHVGGDYYDIIKVDDSKFFVVIGDVSGKGLSASFYMSKLQTIMRLYCVGGRSPKDILVDVNNRISESIEKGWFITVSLALFDMKKGKVIFCRAGHTSLIRIKEGKLFLDTPNGIGVGLEKGKVFDTNLEELELNIGGDELFFLYSDGVNEAENENNDFFGMEKLENILLSVYKMSSKEILEDVITEIKKFRGKAPQNDDITMALVKISK